jgi:glycosyltransferase involved in cell wall biosynthesis
MISVLILTLNEEDNLPRCFASLAWCHDVVILDSFSTDNTVEIASSLGARVFQRQFDDYASQRNFGLNDITYKNRWVLMVDADEEVPSELVIELQSKVNSASDICLYRLRRKDFFLGRWIRRSSGYPTWFGRLIKIGHVRVERAINEEYNTDGEIGFLSEHLHHYPFNKGFSAWFEKHNRYSTMEAALKTEARLVLPKGAELLSSDPTKRRRAVKSLVYHMPFRPLLMFFALYVVRGGFLDGRAGLTFCLLRSFYEFMINCKVQELSLRQRKLPI